MSKPGTSKQKDVKAKQTVMGDYFSKPNKSKKANKGDNSAETSETKRPSLKRKVTGAGMLGFSWTRGAQRDTEEYRNGYPTKKDIPECKDNYLFYMNKIPSKPDGDYIDNIHKEWWGDYKRLEVHHGYIQWLFPIRESGLNWHAQELQLHEIKKLTINKEAMARILTSYKMMLDFYGMEMLNEDDGKLCRAKNWKERFQHLNRSYHNYLRITRILKCLGEFGYERLKKNFVMFVLEEGLEDGTLSNLIDSCVKYWIGVLRDDEERDEMFDYYDKLSSDEKVLAKRRNKSPPSQKKSPIKTEAGTGKRTISKPKKKNLKETKDKDTEKDESSDEDGTLYYAMSLIDEDKDESKVGGKKNSRKDHEMSDSDVGISENESQEMGYWNTEKLANEDKLGGEEESNENERDTNQENENAVSGKNGSDDSSRWKRENRANEHERLCGSESFHGGDSFKSNGDTNQEIKSTDSSKNGVENTDATIDIPDEQKEGNDVDEKVSSDAANVDNNENELTDEPKSEVMETGEEDIQNNVQSKDMDTENIDNNEVQEEAPDTHEDISDKKVDSIEMGLPEEKGYHTRARTAESEGVSEIKTDNNEKLGEPNKEPEADIKSDGTEVMETA